MMFLDCLSNSMNMCLEGRSIQTEDTTACIPSIIGSAVVIYVCIDV